MSTLLNDVLLQPIILQLHENISYFVTKTNNHSVVSVLVDSKDLFELICNDDMLSNYIVTNGYSTLEPDDFISNDFIHALLQPKITQNATESMTKLYIQFQHVDGNFKMYGEKVEMARQNEMGPLLYRLNQAIGKPLPTNTKEESKTTSASNTSNATTSSSSSSTTKTLSSATNPTAKTTNTDTSSATTNRPNKTFRPYKKRKKDKSKPRLQIVRPPPTK